MRYDANWEVNIGVTLVDLKALNGRVCFAFAGKMGAVLSTIFVVLFLLEGRYEEWALLGQLLAVYLIGLPLGGLVAGAGIGRGLLETRRGAVVLGFATLMPVYFSGVVLIIVPEFGLLTAVIIGVVASAIVGPPAALLVRFALLD